MEPRSHGHVRLREHLLATLDRLAPEAAALGNEAVLGEVRSLAQAGRNDSGWLRERYAETRSMPDVVRLQSARWRRGPASGAQPREPERAAR